jgi:hypothetical protein
VIVDKEWIDKMVFDGFEFRSNDGKEIIWVDFCGMKMIDGSL